MAALCKFSEPIAFNSVVAYAFPMSQWLHDGDATNASFYAGALVSAYALGEVLTSIFWGTISDRVGRKPVVLSGLCGVGLSCIMFGLAKSYWIALLARLLGGMLNGNVSVMQTMLAEQIKRPEHERKRVVPTADDRCLFRETQLQPMLHILSFGSLGGQSDPPSVGVYRSRRTSIPVSSHRTAYLPSTLICCPTSFRLWPLAVLLRKEPFS